MKYLEPIITFIQTIGIVCEQTNLVGQKSFLKGIMIDKGRLLYDANILEYEGDLLHEAGHIALETPAHRPFLNDNVEEGKNPAESLEIGVILWSYAALRHLALPIEVVFHQQGYKGQSDFLITSFENGQYIGLPLLQWFGLTATDAAIQQEKALPFPQMIKWLRE